MSSVVLVSISIPLPLAEHTHTPRVMSTEHSLRLMSPHSFLYAENAIHLNRRIRGVGGSLAQTMAVIKHGRFVGSVRRLKMAGAAPAQSYFYCGVTPQTLLASVCLEDSFQRERRGVEDESMGQVCNFKDNGIKDCIKIPLSCTKRSSLT